MKKILIVLLAAFTLALTACAARLSKQEYADRLMELFHDYVGVMSEVTDYREDGDFDFEGFSKRAEEALSAIEGLAAPEEYSEQHKEICEGIKREREWLAVFGEVHTNGTDEDNIDKLQQASEASTFPSAVLDAVKTMKEDGVSFSK